MHNSGTEEFEILHAKKVATELHRGVSGSTHQDDNMVKSEARPETNDATGPGVKKISLLDINNTSLRSQQNRKGDTIPGGVHGMRGFSGETLPWPDMGEVVGPYILGVRNITEKVGNLLGDRPD